MRTRLVAVVSLVVLLISASAASATDNDTSWHRHSRSWGFRTNSALPADWKGAVAEAGRAWTERTRLNFTYNGDINSTDPSTSSHIWWRGTIPSGWQDGCPPASSLACTRWRFESGSNVHLSDADTVFDSGDSMGASSTNCALNIGIDVQTVALHEFGHWGVLSHSSDSNAAMYGAYNDCQRTPAQHDLDSMRAQYAGHA